MTALFCVSGSEMERYVHEDPGLGVRCLSWHRTPSNTLGRFANPVARVPFGKH